MLNKPTWSLSNNRFNPILVWQEIERMDTVEKNGEIGNHWHPVASVILVADCLFISHWAKTEKFCVHVYFVTVIAVISSGLSLVQGTFVLLVTFESAGFHKSL